MALGPFGMFLNVLGRFLKRLGKYWWLGKYLEQPSHKQKKGILDALKYISTRLGRFQHFG